MIRVYPFPSEFFNSPFNPPLELGLFQRWFYSLETTSKKTHGYLKFRPNGYSLSETSACDAEMLVKSPQTKRLWAFILVPVYFPTAGSGRRIRFCGALAASVSVAALFLKRLWPGPVIERLVLASFLAWHPLPIVPEHHLDVYVPHLLSDPPRILSRGYEH